METQARRTPTDLELALNELLSDIIPLGVAIGRPRNDLAPIMMRSEFRREIEEEEEAVK